MTSHAPPHTIPPQGHAPECIWRQGTASIWAVDTGGLLFADSSDLSHVVFPPEDSGLVRGLLAGGHDVQREWAGGMDLATVDTRELCALLVGDPWDVVGWTEAEACDNLRWRLSGDADREMAEEG